MSFYRSLLRYLSSPVAQSGQAGLVVLLLTVVLLTIGISVASRSSTSLSLSRQEEESNQVLYAAEAGIEHALAQDFNFAGNTLTNQIQVDGKTVEYQISKLNQIDTYLFEGVSAQVELPILTTPGSLRVEWQKSCTDDPASLMVTFFSEVGGVASSRTEAYNTVCSSPTNNFSSAVAGVAHRGRVDLQIQPGDLYLRIKPLYSNTEVRIAEQSGVPLSAQYFKIRSSAVNDAGNEQRVVEVNRSLPLVPSFMDYAIFSGTTIQTN